MVMQEIGMRGDESRIGDKQVSLDGINQSHHLRHQFGVRAREGVSYHSKTLLANF